MAKQREFRISLSKRERKDIKKLQKRATSDYARTRYSIILHADESFWREVPTYRQIADRAGVSVPTVIATLRDYVESGLAQAITPERSPASDTARLKATGDIEAKIVAKACSNAPDGRTRWTMTLLSAESAVILETPLSRSTVCRILKRNEIRPHLSEYWCIPPEEDAEFTAHMEDILDLYQQPYDPNRPLWCMDEKPYQLLGESREPIPMRPGDTKKIDSEYVRNGTASIFCFIQPHSGDIFHFAEETRTAVDWAEKIRYLVDDVEPNAEKIVLVMDNLNTHTMASLYKTFPPEEARRIAKKLEIHYTPKHGSWLDIAEIGINIMTRQCLDRRIENIDLLRSELKEWNDAYDKNPTPINWQFTTDDARIKLRRLYPDINKFREERDNRRSAKQSA